MSLVVYIHDGGNSQGDLFAAFDNAKKIIENCMVLEVIIIFFGVRILITENTDWKGLNSTFDRRLKLLQKIGGAETLREEYEKEGLLIGDKEKKGDRLIDFNS